MVMQSAGATYTDPKTGTKLTPYTDGNQSGTVLAGSVFDPNSSNYNPTIANSGGKINLANVGNYDSSGNFIGNNSAPSGGGVSTGVGTVSGSASYSPGSIAVYDPTNDIKAMADAQKKAALAGLDKAHQQSLSDLSYAKQQIEPGYYTQRNSVSTDAQVAAKNFAEYMAQRGSNNPTGISGTMAQSDISNNVALQGNLGNLGTAEAKDYSANAKQVGDLNTAYNNDVASTNAGIDASTMQSLINAQQQYNATKLAQANTDRSFNYTAGQDQFNNGLAVAGLTGTYNGQQTIAGKTADLNNTLTSLGIDTARLNLSALPQQIKDQATLTAQSISKGDIDIQTGQAQLKELTDPNSVTNQLAKFNLDTAKLNYAALPDQLKAQAQQIAQNLAKGAIDIKTAQTQLDYLPQQLQAGINAQNRSNTGGGSNGGSNNGLKPSMSSGSTYNKEVSDINDIVNGSYNLSEKQRVLQSYIADKSTQNGNEAAQLVKYAQQALNNVNQQMSDYVNIGRYAGFQG